MMTAIEYMNADRRPYPAPLLNLRLLLFIRNVPNTTMNVAGTNMKVNVSPRKITPQNNVNKGTRFLMGTATPSLPDFNPFIKARAPRTLNRAEPATPKYPIGSSVTVPSITE